MTGEIPREEFYKQSLWIKDVCLGCHLNKVIHVGFFKCKKCLDKILPEIMLVRK